MILYINGKKTPNKLIGIYTVRTQVNSSNEGRVMSKNSSTVYGPYITLDAGYYFATFYGISGMASTSPSFDCAYNIGNNKIHIDKIYQDDQKVRFVFNISATINNIEFRMFGNVNNFLFVTVEKCLAFVGVDNSIKPISSFFIGVNEAIHSTFDNYFTSKHLVNHLNNSSFLNYAGCNVTQAYGHFSLELRDNTLIFKTTHTVYASLYYCISSDFRLHSRIKYIVIEFCFTTINTEEDIILIGFSPEKYAFKENTGMVDGLNYKRCNFYKDNTKQVIAIPINMENTLIMGTKDLYLVIGFPLGGNSDSNKQDKVEIYNIYTINNL